MLAIGIDPGADGAISFINSVTGVVTSDIMPDTVEGIWDALKAIRINATLEGDVLYVGLERAQAMPGQGCVSMFNYGVGYGKLIALITVLKPASWILIPPRDWQKEAWVGCSDEYPSDKKNRKKNSTAKSCQAIRRLYPNADLHCGPKSGKPHIGVVDAILIADYTLRRFK